MPSSSRRSAVVVISANDGELKSLPVRGGNGKITKVVHHQNFETKGHLIGLSVATHQPGASCDEHNHRGADEQFYVLSGKGVITIDGVKHTVQVGDSVFVPAGAMHIVSADPNSAPFVVQCILVRAPGHESDDMPWLSGTA